MLVLTTSLLIIMPTDWHVFAPKIEAFKERNGWKPGMDSSHLASLGDDVAKHLNDEIAGHESFVKSGARDVDRKRK